MLTGANTLTSLPFLSGRSPTDIFWASTTPGLSDTVNRRFSYILAKKGFDGALERVTRHITSMLRRAVARVGHVSAPTLSSSRPAALGRREYLLGEPVQIGEHERLCEDGYRALGEEALVLGRVRRSTDEKEAREELGPPPCDLTVKADPIELRHAKVTDNKVVCLRFDFVEREETVGSQLDPIPSRFQYFPEHLGDPGLVLDHQDEVPPTSGSLLGHRSSSPQTYLSQRDQEIRVPMAVTGLL